MSLSLVFGSDSDPNRFCKSVKLPPINSPFALVPLLLVFLGNLYFKSLPNNTFFKVALLTSKSVLSLSRFTPIIPCIEATRNLFKCACKTVISEYPMSHLGLFKNNVKSKSSIIRVTP